MKLQSNIDLTYSFGNVNGSTEVGVVEGFINRTQTDLEGNKNFLFSYKTPEGVAIKTDWLKDSITKEQADALYSAVASSLPDISVVGYSAWNDSLLMEAFRVEMAATFGVEVADIDIIT